MPVFIARAIFTLQTIDLLMILKTQLLVTCLGLVLTTAGCHRQYYRKQADNEVRHLIAEKERAVARPPNRPWDFQVDRRSRMFNPFDLDFQPMPLDDPASYRYMQCVDGRRGYPMWEAAGITNAEESPDWWQFLPLNEDGVLVLNSENAVRIALLHSPEYQRQVEQLYFAALDVSRERFQFDTQFFGGLGNDLTSNGQLRGGQTIYGVGPNNLTMNRAFATGADLVVNFANRITWELSGSNRQSASTLIDFAFLQPLLRGAGRDRVLEQLTQTERDLLAQVRSFERFRRSFFLRITTGRGLELTSTGIVTVNAGGIGGAGGYLGLLQQQQQIRNQEENIARQTENLLLSEDNLIELLTQIPDDPGQIITEQLQVAQARQRLLSSQSSLINQQAAFQRSIDSFMRDLGLPPYICARLDDPILDRFELIDRELLERRKQLSDVRAKVGAINISILELVTKQVDPATGVIVRKLEWSPKLKALVESLRAELRPVVEFNQLLIENDLPQLLTDIEDFEESFPARKRQNDDLLDLYHNEQQSICSLVGVSDINESIFDLSEIETLAGKLREEHQEIAEHLTTYRERIDVLAQVLEQLVTQGPANADPAALPEMFSRDVIQYSQALLSDMGEDVLEIQLIQARARTEGVLLPEVDIDPATAFEIARKNRRDWANARAALVDSWRNIEFVADQLESSLDVTFEGDIGNVSNNPFDLRSSNGSLRVGLLWDAPITRVIERNDYRAVLIQYEQDRRRYYGYEDSIWQLLRNEIRTLQQNRYDFEIGRQAVRSAAAQIQLNTARTSLNEAQGRAGGPTAARDAIDALNDLLNAQNGLLNVFVNYEVVRRTLDLDLGTMELTPEGLWLDPGVITPDTLLTLPGTTVEGLIECGCNDCGLRYNPLPQEPVFSDVVQPLHSHGSMVELPPEGEFQESVDPLPPPVHSGPLPAPVAPEREWNLPPESELTLPPPVPSPTAPAPRQGTRVMPSPAPRLPEPVFAPAPAEGTLPPVDYGLLEL